MRIPHPLWIWFWLILTGLVGLAGLLAYWEAQTSYLQAHYLSAYAARMRTTLEPGENPELRFPVTGPYNLRLGYAYIPHFVKALQGDGFDVAWQMRATADFNHFVDRGGFPIYRSKNYGGLTIFDRNGAIMHQAQFPTRVFGSFAAIPQALVSALQFIEDRAVLDSPYDTHNPAIDWGRFSAAVAGQIVGVLVPRFNIGGGSTLATQIEKFRHSPGGMTNGVRDKLRQIATASVRAYLGGPDTRKASREIVLNYLNATPLAARPGWGEINGVGDGLWAWFGIDLRDAVQAMALPETPEALPRKAFMYKHALALILSERRPSYYLIANPSALEQLTNTTLVRLQSQGIVSAALAQTAEGMKLRFLPTPPDVPQGSFIAQKASNAIRRHLSFSLGLDNLYELDHIDAAIGTTLDKPTQDQVTQFLERLHEPDFFKTVGLEGFRLLNAENDPSKINWTLILFERTPTGNALRVQADNLDKPLDLNDGAKLDLGSTAKLRTLVSYLEIVSEIHARLASLEAEALREILDGRPDALTVWVAQWLLANKDDSLTHILAAAMERKYSANPGEGFFTGGGLHYFNNFEPNDNGKVVTIGEALRKSINLPFIRLMRDVINYEMAQGPVDRRDILDDPDNPARQTYLERFADAEGTTFLNNFYNQYQKLSASEAVVKLTRGGQKRAHTLAVIFRSLYPGASEASFITFVRTLRPDYPSSDAVLRQNFASYPKDRFNLADRAYVAGVHPLEMWLVEYLIHNPGANRKAVIEASRRVRIESYAWLFKSGRAAQNSRIRTLLEKDAFVSLHRRWARLGYPFEKLVPSLASSIGSSADRPGALAVLMGIILNDGEKLPTVRANYVNFALQTPFQTMMARKQAKGERLMQPEVARTLRAALRDVVANGTAKRVDGAFAAPDGAPLPIGGKTGTGDHRYDQYGPGGRLISSRVVNRTATLVFYIGDRFFGSITAYVAGPDAANYHFTSALPSQMLRVLSPTLLPLINGPPGK